MTDVKFAKTGLSAGTCCYSSGPSASGILQGQEAELLSPEEVVIICGDVSLYLRLLGLKLEACYRLFRNRRFERAGLFDGLYGIKKRKNRSEIYFYKRLVFLSLATLHLFVSDAAGKRKEIADYLFDEYKKAVCLEPSEKFCRAVKRLLEYNVPEDAAGAPADSVIQLWAMGAASNRLQRNDRYLWEVLPDKKPRGGSGLLFNDPEFAEGEEYAPLPVYEGKYYLDLADEYK
ncbi:MAG: hypothetical protein ILO36_00045 [Abditibacteriota bacterium]|nr:hypothetical protein [Abditibacteriota bacterium]